MNIKIFNKYSNITYTLITQTRGYSTYIVQQDCTGMLFWLPVKDFWNHWHRV